MNTITPNLLIAFALFGLIAASQAASAKEAEQCSMLMTQLECDQHQTTLAQLKPGSTRDQYLAALDTMLLDREAACSCNRKVMQETIYPAPQQALLQF